MSFHSANLSDAVFLSRIGMQVVFARDLREEVNSLQGFFPGVGRLMVVVLVQRNSGGGRPLSGTERSTMLSVTSKFMSV